MCKQELPETSEYFASRYDKKVPMFQGVCRECQKQYRKEHYQKNKEKYIKKASSYTKDMIAWLQELKSTLYCEKCGDARWWVLDFHHNDPSEKNEDISTLVRKGNKERVLNEIEKCSILCANCHRDIHHQQKQVSDA